MQAEPLPCDREETEEQIELRKIISEYDDLLDLCHSQQLTPEQVHALDELYALLLLREQEEWEDGANISGLVVETIRDVTDIDFPMLRFQLGIIEDYRNN